MNKHIMFICLLGLFLFNSCKNKNNIPECEVNDPLEELSWLQEIKNSLSNCYCTTSIFQGNYKKKTVFFTMTNDSVCNSIFDVTIWDCNGNTVKEYKSGDSQLFSEEVSIVKKLYTCP